MIIERSTTTKGVSVTSSRAAKMKQGVFMSKRIGGTTYHVSAIFNPASTETLQDKILRLVKNDLNLAPLRATMELPQTGRLLEGGSF